MTRPPPIDRTVAAGAARPLRIAFVACNRNASRFRDDPSFVYRCDNLGRALQAAGHAVAWLHLSALPRAGRFDVAVLHRPRQSVMLTAALAWLRLRGARLVADVDDLVFDPTLAEHSPGVVNGLVSLATTRAQFSAHRAALARCARITVSTEPLADAARRSFPRARVTVLPNAVHAAWRPLPWDRPATAVAPLISYSPGTRSHDRDFAAVAGALSRVLERHPDARLQITGPLQHQLSARPGQIDQCDKLPFAEYHVRVRAARINLAPLVDSPFTRCKSALKVIEAGFWGIPTVCSPLRDAQRFAGAGAHFADTELRWEQALERLLVDDIHYAQETAGLRERVLARADIDVIAASWLDALASEQA